MEKKKNKPRVDRTVPKAKQSMKKNTYPEISNDLTDFPEKKYKSPEFHDQL